MQDPAADISQDVRQTQVLAGALLAGVAIFAAIALAISGPPVAANGQVPMVAIVMAVMAVIEVPAFIIMPQKLLSAPSPLINRYRGAMLLRYAFCNGACFANLIGYIIDKQWWSLAIVGFLVLVMLSMFPTRTKLEHWLETQELKSEQGF